MHCKYIPQYAILQQKCVHVCIFFLQNGALWDMGLVYGRICAASLLGNSFTTIHPLFWNQKSEIRKRLFGIFTVRRKWLHKHALFCKCKVSQCWMQRNLLLKSGKRLNIVRKKHSQVFLSFMKFRCISSAIWSVKLPSLAVRGGTVGTFCIAATANAS